MDAVQKINSNLLRTVLTSPVGTNSFLQLGTAERYQFVLNIYRQTYQSQEIVEVLASKYYAPYLLLILTQRDIFMKMTDFTVYI